MQPPAVCCFIVLHGDMNDREHKACLISYEHKLPHSVHNKIRDIETNTVCPHNHFHKFACCKTLLMLALTPFQHCFNMAVAWYPNLCAIVVTEYMTFLAIEAAIMTMW